MSLGLSLHGMLFSTASCPVYPFYPLLQTFFVDDDLKDACQLDAVLTVVDAKHVTMHLDEVKPEDVVNEAGEGPCLGRDGILVWV
jgi:hypothetical protein